MVGKVLQPRPGTFGPSSTDVHLLLHNSASKTSEALGSESWKRQLELAIAWNRVDIAKTEIFSEESHWKVSKIIQRSTHP